MHSEIKPTSRSFENSHCLLSIAPNEFLAVQAADLEACFGETRGVFEVMDRCPSNSPTSTPPCRFVNDVSAPLVSSVSHATLQALWWVRGRLTAMVTTRIHPPCAVEFVLLVTGTLQHSLNRSFSTSKLDLWLSVSRGLRLMAMLSRHRNQHVCHRNAS